MPPRELTQKHLMLKLKRFILTFKYFFDSILYRVKNVLTPIKQKYSFKFR
jgi:hypothetical protein